MLSELRVTSKGQSGFTLVEVLVVMVIIGLLAAIAIPAFFSQKGKAGDAGAKEAAHTAQTAMETYSTDHAGSYTGATQAELEEIEPSLENAPFLEVLPNNRECRLYAKRDGQTHQNALYRKHEPELSGLHKRKYQQGR